jgi:hypothetical protein
MRALPSLADRPLLTSAALAGISAGLGRIKTITRKTT